MDIRTMRFLAIDDHSLLRKMITKILGDIGVTHIDSVADSQEGLKSINAARDAGAPYDVVILDWGMPNMSGYDVLVACRADRRNDTTAILMLTAESGDASIVKALGAGATAYITKPFVPDTIAAKLGDIIKWREKIQAGSAPGKP